LTGQPKASEFGEIDSRLAALDERVRKTSEEIHNLIEKRDKQNEKVRLLQQEIRELKSERDNLNEKVQTFKLMRDETRTKTKNIITDIKARQERIAELRKKTPKASFLQLQKEQEDIEWKIQTTSLDLQEEKRLVEDVKQLEIQMEAYKKKEKLLQKIADLRKELKTLDEKANAFHQELSSSAQKSQEIHQKVITKIDEMKKIRAEADSLHQTYLKARLEVEPLNAELRGLLAQRKRLQQRFKDDDVRKRKASEQALKEKLGSQAKEKLQRGEKLSWDEFQLLADDESQTKN